MHKAATNATTGHGISAARNDDATADRAHVGIATTVCIVIRYLFGIDHAGMQPPNVIGSVTDDKLHQTTPLMEREIMFCFFFKSYCRFALAASH